MEGKMTYPFAMEEIDRQEKAGEITAEEAEIRRLAVNNVRRIFKGKAGQTVKRTITEAVYGIGAYEDLNLAIPAESLKDPAHLEYIQLKAYEKVDKRPENIRVIRKLEEENLAVVDKEEGRIIVNNDTATINGNRIFKSASVMASDLRASVSLVLAGLCGQGITTINRVYHLDRGYENIEETLGKCGPKILRLK